MEKILEKLRQKENLTFDESKSAFELLMTGKASEDEIYSFLTLLSEKVKFLMKLLVVFMCLEKNPKE